jgi:hypothetical protein
MLDFLCRRFLAIMVIPYQNKSGRLPGRQRAYHKVLIFQLSEWGCPGFFGKLGVPKENSPYAGLTFPKAFPFLSGGFGKGRMPQTIAIITRRCYDEEYDP